MTKCESDIVSYLRSEISPESSWVREIIEIISKTCNPEDVFSDESLVEWAEANGFVQEGSKE